MIDPKSASRILVLIAEELKRNESRCMDNSEDRAELAWAVMRHLVLNNCVILEEKE